MAKPERRGGGVVGTRWLGAPSAVDKPDVAAGVKFVQSLRRPCVGRRARGAGFLADGGHLADTGFGGVWVLAEAAGSVIR